MKFSGSPSRLGENRASEARMESINANPRMSFVV